MAVVYKASMNKGELLEIAAANGVAADSGMTKTEILDALEAHNRAEAADLAAEGGTDGGDTPTGGNDPAPAEKPTEGAEGGTDGGNTPTGGNDHAPAEKPAEGAENTAEGYDTFVYVGPSIPNGRLKANAVFRGTFRDVTAYLAGVLEDYPQVEKLIVPVNRLAAFAVRVKTPGNIAHKYYNDIVSAMRRNKEV